MPDWFNNKKRKTSKKEKNIYEILTELSEGKLTIEETANYLTASLPDLEYIIETLEGIKEQKKFAMPQAEKMLESAQKLKPYVKALELKNEAFNDAQKELDKLRQRTGFSLVGTVEEILEDRSLVIMSINNMQKIATRMPIHPPIRLQLKEGRRVLVHPQSYQIMDILPKGVEQDVKSMEVIERPRESYGDIGGLDEQIQRIRQKLERPMLVPQLYKAMGIEPVKGILLYGPPGCGKTLLGKALAREAKASFINVVASEFLQKYIGEGSRKVREMFALAKEKAPSIIFIDELDALGRKRIGDDTSGGREVAGTLMQFLGLMDGFDPYSNVKIIAATNRPDTLDPALIRSGRFSELIEIPYPNEKGREQILGIHTRKKPVKDKEKIIKWLIEETKGSSGSDLAYICNDAAEQAIEDMIGGLTEGRVIPSENLKEYSIEQINDFLKNTGKKIEITREYFEGALKEWRKRGQQKEEISKANRLYA